jgi:hypothetical protein
MLASVEPLAKQILHRLGGWVDPAPGVHQAELLHVLPLAQIVGDRICAQIAQLTGQTGGKALEHMAFTRALVRQTVAAPAAEEFTPVEFCHAAMTRATVRY